MATSSRCFLAYPFGDRQSNRLIRDVVQPALAETGWESIDIQSMDFSRSIYNSIATELRRADLVIADFSGGNANVIYEVGLAHGWGKPTIFLTRSLEVLPFDLGSLRVLPYAPETMQSGTVAKALTNMLLEAQRAPVSLVDATLRRYVRPQTSVGIEILGSAHLPLQNLRRVNQIASALDSEDALSASLLAEVRLGSLGAWFSTNLASVTNLVEKVLFFVPEWRIKNAQRVKIEAEADLLLAQADRHRTEASAMSRQANREDARMLLEILMEAGVPARVSIGDQLRVEGLGDGTVVIGGPFEEEQRTLPGP